MKIPFHDQIKDNVRLRCDVDCMLFHRLGNNNENDKTTQCRLCFEKDDKNNNGR